MATENTPLKTFEDKIDSFSIFLQTAYDIVCAMRGQDENDGPGNTEGEGTRTRLSLDPEKSAREQANNRLKVAKRRCRLTMRPSVDLCLRNLEEHAQYAGRRGENESIPRLRAFADIVASIAANELLHLDAVPFSQADPKSKLVLNWASLLGAITQMQLSCIAYDRTTDATEEKVLESMDKAVEVLDRALIVTEGYQCEENINDMLALIDTYLKGILKPYRGGSIPVQTSDIPILKFPGTELDQPTGMEFLDHFFNAGTPALLHNTLGHWLALEEGRWDFLDYWFFRTIGGRRIVPVEVGGTYLDDAMKTELMTFAVFIDRFIMKEHKESSEMGYLAQHDLLTQIPELRKDVAVPDYIQFVAGCADEKENICEPVSNVWFGPAGTVTPLHFDKHWNILCQVIGYKYVRLYSPDQTDKLYPRGVTAQGIDQSNSSYVEVEGKTDQFPLFGSASYIEFLLGPGDCIYIPRGWWHYVRSLSISISVNFWWDMDVDNLAFNNSGSSSPSPEAPTGDFELHTEFSGDEMLFHTDQDYSD